MASTQYKSAIKPPDSTDQEEAISLPLYLSGLVVSLSGIVAVNSALPDGQFSATTILLTIIGFVFSIACRILRIKVRVLEILGACVAGYFIYRYFTNSFSLEALIPPDINQGDLIMAIVLEWLTVVRSWILTSDDSVVFTTVTSVAMIGLVGAYNINVELLFYFFIFIVAATFLLLHQNYLANRSWAAARVTRSSDHGILNVQVILAMAAGVAAVLLGTIVIIPVRAVGSHLSLANALRNLVNAGKAGDNQNASPQTEILLSDDKALRVGTGSGFSASDTVVVRVFTNDSNEHYYRGRTYDYYQGNGWNSTLEQDSSPLAPSMNGRFGQAALMYNMAAPGDQGGDISGGISFGAHSTDVLQTRFEIQSGKTSTLYLPTGTSSVFLPKGRPVGVVQSSDNHIELSESMENGFSYGAAGPNVTPSSVQLASAPSLAAGCPAQIRTMFISQRGEDVVAPADQEQLSQTAASIINKLPLNHRSEYDMAEAIRQWVSQDATYSLAVGAVPDDQDAVSYFLFKSRKGYCDLFASSMAILCRYAGIPSRVATGFDPGIRDDEGGFDLRAEDKHAWVEVWFPKYGWQLFDPTEGSVADSSASTSLFDTGWLTSLLNYVRNYFDINGPLPFLILCVVIVGLAFVIKREVIDRLRINMPGFASTSIMSLDKALKVSRDAAGIYARDQAGLRYEIFEQILKHRGLVRAKSMTPVEFLKHIDICAADAPDPIKDQLLTASRELTDDMMMAAYAPLELVAETLIERETAGIGNAALKVIRLNSGVVKSWTAKRKSRKQAVSGSRL